MPLKAMKNIAKKNKVPLAKVEAAAKKIKGKKK